MILSPNWVLTLLPVAISYKLIYSTCPLVISSLHAWDVCNKMLVTSGTHSNAPFWLIYNPWHIMVYLGFSWMHARAKSCVSNCWNNSGQFPHYYHCPVVQPPPFFHPVTELLCDIFQLRRSLQSPTLSSRTLDQTLAKNSRKWWYNILDKKKNSPIFQQTVRQTLDGISEISWPWYIYTSLTT